MPVGYPNQNNGSNGNKTTVVTVSTTSNISLTSGIATYDGYTVSNGNTILVWQQTPDTGNGNANNGIYTFNGVGQPLTRAVGFTLWNSFIDLFISVANGTAHKGDTFVSDAQVGGILGTTELLISNAVSGGVTRLNGLSADVTIDSPNETLTINENSQTIELDIDFTNKTYIFNELNPMDLTKIGSLITTDGTNAIALNPNSSTVYGRVLYQDKVGNDQSLQWKDAFDLSSGTVTPVDSYPTSNISINAFLNRLLGQTNNRVKIYDPACTDNNVVYNVGEIVNLLSNGKLYKCILQNTANSQPPNTAPTYWSEYISATVLTTLGDTLSNDGTNDIRIAGNTTTTLKIYSQTGNGTVSALPSWIDIPTDNISTTMLNNQIRALFTYDRIVQVDNLGSNNRNANSYDTLTNAYASYSSGHVTCYIGEGSFTTKNGGYSNFGLIGKTKEKTIIDATVNVLSTSGNQVEIKNLTVNLGTTSIALDGTTNVSQVNTTKSGSQADFVITGTSIKNFDNINNFGVSTLMTISSNAIVNVYDTQTPLLITIGSGNLAPTINIFNSTVTITIANGNTANPIININRSSITGITHLGSGTPFINISDSTTYYNGVSYVINLPVATGGMTNVSTNATANTYPATGFTITNSPIIDDDTIKYDSKGKMYVPSASGIEVVIPVDFITFVPVGTFSGIKTLIPLNRAGDNYITTNNNRVLCIGETNQNDRALYLTTSTGAWTLIKKWEDYPIFTSFTILNTSTFLVNIMEGQIWYKFYSGGGLQFMLPLNGCMPVKYIEFDNELTLSGEPTINGVQLKDGDIVLPQYQVNINNNQFYRVSTTAWTIVSQTKTFNLNSVKIFQTNSNTNGLEYNIYNINGVTGSLEMRKPPANPYFYMILSNSPVRITRDSAFDTWTTFDQALDTGASGDARLMWILDTPNGKLGGENPPIGTQSNLVYGSAYCGFTNNVAYFNVDAVINDGWNDTQFFDFNSAVIGTTGNAGIYINRSSAGPWNTGTSFSTYWYNGTLGNSSRKSIEIVNNILFDDYIPFDISDAEFVGDVSLEYGYIQGTITNPVCYKRATTWNFGNTDGTSVYLGSSLFVKGLDLYYQGATFNHKSSFWVFENSFIANATINLLGTQTNATQMLFINTYFDFSTVINRTADGYLDGLNISCNAGFDVSQFDTLTTGQNQTSQTFTTLTSGAYPINSGVANVYLNSSSDVTSLITLQLSGLIANQDFEITNIGAGSIRSVRLQLLSGWSYSANFPTYTLTSLGVKYYIFSMTKGDRFRFRVEWKTKTLILLEVLRGGTNYLRIGINSQSYTGTSNYNLVWNNSATGYNVQLPNTNAWLFTTGYLYLPFGGYYRVRGTIFYSLVPSGLGNTSMSISTSNSNTVLAGKLSYTYSGGSANSTYFTNSSVGQLEFEFFALTTGNTTSNIQTAILFSLQPGADTFATTNGSFIEVEQIDKLGLSDASLIQ